MTGLTVGLDERSYSIDIGCSSLSGYVRYLDRIAFPRRVVVITNDTVEPLYGVTVADNLKSGGYSVDTVVIKDGEEYKSAQTLNDIYTELIKLKCDRHSGIVAVGGGVVGDIAGYAAATFLRGIPFAQVPTTLLAQVDSSVGGKTAINHPLGKNLIGAFYQPRHVMIDVATLRTLSQRHFVAGLAEVIKYGVIYSSEFFAWLEENVDAVLALETTALIYAVECSCKIKAAVVERDETEQSLRAILNFGHTFGHAVEQLSGYGQVLHGEAVAIGMVVAARISAATGKCGSDDVERLCSLLSRCGLPISVPQFTLSQYIEAMARDKKVQSGVLRLVLNRGIGDCEIHSVDNVEAIFARALA